MENINNEVDTILKSGYALMTDLLTQANNLSVTFSEESEENGNESITSRALKTSIVMLTFNSIEAFCNFMSQLVVQISISDESFSNKLTQTEIDFLLEQETYLDTRTGNLKINKNKYFSITDKLAIVPLLFAKIHGDSFRLDKGNEQWRSFIKYKEIRDNSTHIKFDIAKIAENLVITNDLNKQSPAYYIHVKELFFGIVSIREYIFTFNSIIMQYYTSQKLFLGVIDLFYWMVLLNLKKACAITDNEFSKLRTPPVNSKDKPIIS
ncbi:hypothetical protein [Paenibacillus glycanilyticus]|uniref:hypothetical protein n=1 Tax=Paenibacillus glycanilyticus TaxID=126569 RepID=UPI000FD7436E|nr:hypothetical protein [Paenibacillus glycanilyticus]